MALIDQVISDPSIMVPKEVREEILRSLREAISKNL